MERAVIEYQKLKMIDDIEYKISVMSPSRSIKLLVKIAKILGEPFASMISSVKSAGNEKEADEKFSQALPKVISALVSRLDEDEVLAVIQQLVSTCECDGKQISFERHFQARLGHLMKVIRVTLEVQYGDFIGALTSLMSGD